MKILVAFFNFLQLPDKYVVPAAGIVSVIVFLYLFYLCSRLVRYASEKHLVERFFKGSEKWREALIKFNLFAVLGYFLAGLLAKMLIPLVFPPEYGSIYVLMNKLFIIYIMWCFLLLINRILSLVVFFNSDNPNLPVKGTVQAIKIVINCLGILVILAFMLGKEPLVLISALGLMASALMLVFKDPILGLAATFQLSLNNMLRIGDWIEMPKHGADGDVIDIALTTVRVQNWDKTIVSIPSYDLVSSSFKNWRGMTDAGGRRIKRAINVDLQTIKFMDKELTERCKNIKLIRPYLESKEKEIGEYNSKNQVDDPTRNGRALTNVGTFRHYCEEYLKSRTFLRQDYTVMVRQLAPGSQGLPLEIYCFVADIRWVYYEMYQSDIFDHLFAIMKEFDLQPFQEPSGRDFASLKK